MLIVCGYKGCNYLDSRIISFKENRNVAEVEMYENASGYVADTELDIYFIPISKEITSAKICYEKPKKQKVDDVEYKPIIYIYPTNEMTVSVKLLNKDRITCSYPKYIDGWNVLAKPNGDLKDLDTGRNLYALYYESKNKISFDVQNDGFVVKGEDTSKFLEEKLAILGLNERETEEFIVYWLPKLEKNKYNYIRFATLDEINENMPLDIKPKPESIIRILMTYKELEEQKEIEEQKLETPVREGYTVVEWGGTKISN